MRTNKSISLTVLTSMFLSTGTALASEPTAAYEAETKIALAAREATVVEDIVKAACMMHLGVDADRHRAMIDRDTVHFDAVMNGLQFGDGTYGLTRETNQRVIDALRVLKIDWLPFKERAEAVLEAGTPDSDAVLWLGEKDLKLLDDVEKLVSALEKAYGGEALPLHVIVATKLAQRQATIAQRIAKETCFISAGLKVDEMRSKQAEMIVLFENTMTALRDGMPMLGIQKPKNAAVLAQWGVVETSWATLKASIAPIADGGVLDDVSLEQMSQNTTALVEEITTVVGLYAAEML
ncbi:MAG: type IV pili methyl-accepting chemotaxis transducer N-terminal domain-containing protein [Pseudomonadota bacterium]